MYKASDTQSNGKTVAIKVQPYEDDLIVHINEEYRILRDFSSHPNLPDFLGVYRKKGDGDNPPEIWFILEVSIFIKCNGKDFSAHGKSE